MLALIALAVSGLTLVWTIFWSLSQRRLATRPRLTVDSVWAFPTYGPELGPQCIQTTATNTGLAPVTLNGCSLLIRGARRARVPLVEWVHESPPLPTRLEPGADWTGSPKWSRSKGASTTITAPVRAGRSARS